MVNNTDKYADLFPQAISLSQYCDSRSCLGSRSQVLYFDIHTSIKKTVKNMFS